MKILMLSALGALLGMLVTDCQSRTQDTATPDDVLVSEVVRELLARHGRESQARIETGVRQVQRQWRPEDGDRERFADFCRENFIADPELLGRSFIRLERIFEELEGHLTELGRELRWNLDVDTGPIPAVDHLLANLNLGSHLEEDLYRSKIAFFVLLNYPLYTLEECLQQGERWSRQTWAEVRLAQKFDARVPAAVNQRVYEAFVAADKYITNYNIHLDHVLTAGGRRLFPAGLRLIAHWGLRDELKAQYAQPEGLERQRLIQAVMLKIITQEIPALVIDNPAVDWQVATNAVSGAGTDNTPEPDTRYRHLRNIFLAQQAADPWYPLYPNFIQRRFNVDREIPEATVRNLLVELLTSEEFRRTGAEVRRRLGRELEPFDIWYTGFGERATPQAELDRIVSGRYPTARDFERAIPGLLQRLGFDPETARFLSDRIAVDAARGSGHAMGAGRRSDKAHLRTRVSAGGMDYKGFNIAVHELGHNVEQVFGLNRNDHTLLEGVPNTAFTEAFAFVFQSRDLELLGLPAPERDGPDLEPLQRLWSVCEIAGVALVDMDVWHWMYAHPDFTPAELKEAVIRIARDTWNTYFEPVLGHRDSPLLAIYSHMIDAGLYLPDYPLGHIIETQIEEYVRTRDLAREMERLGTLGNLTPEVWMRRAVGGPITVVPLLQAARAALEALEE